MQTRISKPDRVTLRANERVPDVFQSFGPPSTGMIAPVIQRALSEATKTITSATLAGSPIRLSTCMERVALRPASVFVKLDASVSINPGEIAFTRMPFGPNAAAQCFTSVSNCFLGGGIGGTEGDRVIQKQIKLDFVATRPHQHQRGVKLVYFRRYQARALDSVKGEAQADSTAPFAIFLILRFSPVDTCPRVDSSSIFLVAA
jgi:hypothetical protein